MSQLITVHLDGKLRVQSVNNDPSLTEQHYRDQCDVNLIYAKYQSTGEWSHLSNRQGVYADVSGITDYATSLQKVLDAQNSFMCLPAQIRTRFGNDPAQLLEFLQDPLNYAEGVKLGLLNPRAELPPNANPNANLTPPAPPPTVP